MENHRLHRWLTGAGAVVWNVALLYVAYMVTRVAFWLENYGMYEHVVSSPKKWEIFWGGVYFDTSAIAYTNAVYLVMVMMPWGRWAKWAKWTYMGINGLALATNLGDAVYFQYTARRTTIAFFSEFGADDQLGSIVGLEFVRHWYLVLLFVALMWFLWRCYVTPTFRLTKGTVPIVRHVLILAVAGYLCWAGMRGGFWDNRPIKISTANQFIDKPNDASLILNTPFSLLRTIGKHSYVNPGYYQSRDELEAIYNPIHQLPSTIDDLRSKKNVVVIFLESFGREYVGSLNQEVLPGYRGYTPFLDSLMQEAVSFEYSYANGKSSIDAMPSALSGLPMFVESFVAASHATNHLGGMAACLDSLGYETAFFHGAPASSLGFQGFTRATGFQQCFSQEDYEADKRTNGKADSDNWWGIWDEPFLQYFRMKMSDMKEPFMTALFTLSSHHPFHVPEQYQEVYQEEEMPIHKCIRYTDHALKLFFEAARKEPWFKNTVFVMTGDHTNMSNHAEYKSAINQFSTTLIIYDASGELKPGIRKGIAQQTDILPTILNLVGYDQPYMAFGCDLLNTPAEETWAVNYLDGVYQYCQGDYVLQFDGEKTIGLYELKDYRMEEDLIKKLKNEKIKELKDDNIIKIKDEMEGKVKAIVQQYMERMIDNRLVP